MASSSELELRAKVGQMEALVARLLDENGRLLREIARDGLDRRTSDEERVYLGSKTRRTFHRPGCKWANYIPTLNLIEFGSHREAVEAGYKPCKTCRA